MLMKCYLSIIIPKKKILLILLSSLAIDYNASSDAWQDE